MRIPCDEFHTLERLRRAVGVDRRAIIPEYIRDYVSLNRFA